MAKFTYIGPNHVEIDDDGNKKEVAVNAYGGEKLMTGDVIELDGWLATKAEKNPNYEKVKPGPKKKVKEEVVEKPLLID